MQFWKMILTGQESRSRWHLDLAPLRRHEPDHCGLLRTLLDVVPEVITQEGFDNYIDAVYDIRWHFHSQLRSYNEQATL